MLQTGSGQVSDADDGRHLAGQRTVGHNPADVGQNVGVEGLTFPLKNIPQFGLQ